MEEAPENGKELLHSAHANGMNERTLIIFNRETYPTHMHMRVYIHTNTVDIIHAPLHVQSLLNSVP
jgi:hypothetical protein